MDKETIKDILDKYGLERILEDNQTTLVVLLDLLIDLGYLDMEMYLEDD